VTTNYKWNLKLNVAKIGYMECGKQEDGTTQIDGQPLNKTTEFKYLGALIDCHGEATKVNATWNRWRQVTCVLSHRKIPTNLKSKIYKPVLRPVDLHGSQFNRTTIKENQAMDKIDMKMLRWALNVTRQDHAKKWRISPSDDRSGTNPRLSTTATTPVVWTRSTKLPGQCGLTSDADQSG